MIWTKTRALERDKKSLLRKGFQDKGWCLVTPWLSSPCPSAWQQKNPMSWFRRQHPLLHSLTHQVRPGWLLNKTDVVTASWSFQPAGGAHTLTVNCLKVRRRLYFPWSSLGWLLEWHLKWHPQHPELAGPECRTGASQSTKHMPEELWGREEPGVFQVAGVWGVSRRTSYGMR